MTKATRHFTYEVTRNGRRFSRHLNYELAQKEVKRACSRMGIPAEEFAIQEIKK